MGFDSAQPSALAALKSSENQPGASPQLLCETLGEFDQNAPIGRVPDFSEGDDEP
jgi:hypothetical protein